MPHLESLSLFKVEESNEEAVAFSSLAIVAALSTQPEHLEGDIAMEGIIPTETIPVKPTEQPRPPAIQPQEASKGASQYKTNDWVQVPGPPSHPIVPRPTTTKTPLVSSFGEEFRNQTAPEPIHPIPLPLLTPAFEEEEEEEEMPVINMSSDSEIEEDV